MADKTGRSILFTQSVAPSFFGGTTIATLKVRMVHSQSTSCFQGLNQTYKKPTYRLLEHAERQDGPFSEYIMFSRTKPDLQETNLQVTRATLKVRMVHSQSTSCFQRLNQTYKKPTYRLLEQR